MRSAPHYTSRRLGFRREGAPLYLLALLLAPAPAFADGFGWFALATLTIVGITVMATAAIRQAMLPRFTNGETPSFFETSLLTVLDAGLFLAAVKLATLFSPFREPLELLVGATLLHAVLTVATNAYLVRGSEYRLKHALILGGVFPLVFWVAALSLFLPLQANLRGY